jgi:hypothetical protein
MKAYKRRKKQGQKKKKGLEKKKMVNLQFTMKAHWSPSGVQKEQKKEGKC